MDKVRFGMIGCGGFARFHMRQMAEFGECEIVGLADTSEQQLKLTLDSFPTFAGLPKASDYRSMLDEARPDAVVISTPHTLHTEQMLECFGRGLHVLVDKPMVTSVFDAHQVISARNANGKQGMISYQRHTQGEFRFIQETIASGKYGGVQCLQASLSQEWKRATTGSWRQDPKLSGGGQLNDSGSHMLDIILWATGLKASRVAAFCDNRGTQVDINSTLAIEFEGGAQGSICIAGDAPGWNEDITIWCERAAFILRQGKLMVWEENGTKYTFDQITGMGGPERNFARAVLGTEKVQAPLECGLRVIELTEAAWRSAERGGQAVAVADLKQ